MKKSYKNKIYKGCLVGLLLGIFLTIGINLLPKPWSVTFFNVGQGEAALIQGGQQETVLIDGGPDQSIVNLLANKLSWGRHSIDLVILSHPHSDHLAGLVAVMNKYQVKKILMPEVTRTTTLYKQFQKIIQDKKIEVLKPRLGYEYKIGSSINMQILSIGLPKQAEIDPNFASLVVKISNGQNDFLFMGDAPEEVEKIMLANETAVAAEVIKVAHQGSQTSSSLEFLTKVKPVIAVISVGLNNSYGHPNQKVLNNLKSVKAKVLRTDQDGEINMVINNGQIKIIKSWYLNWLVFLNILGLLDSQS